MKARFLLSTIVFSLALAAPAVAQDSSSAPSNSPAGPQGNGGYGQRGGGRGGAGMGMGMATGRGVMGTVTEAAADHYMVKTDTGETYTVHFSVNTRIVKQPAGGRGPGGMGRGEGQDSNGVSGRGMGRGMGNGGNPPQTIKATDIKVGDAVGAMGEMDAATKSLGAVMIVQLDPERAKQMEEMRANYGKTWLQGKVTAIDGVKVTVQGMMDNSPHSFTADENTVFRRRREPITLADIEVGDMVRAEGTLKDGGFTATSVSVMGMARDEGAPPPPSGLQPQ